MIRGCIEFLRAANRCALSGVSELSEPRRLLLVENEGAQGPYGIFLAKMLEPMWEVGMRSTLRGRDTSGLRAKLGGSFAARSEAGPVAGWAMSIGVAGRAIVFFTNFLWTYLSMIHFSRDSLSELVSGFCLVQGMLDSNT